MFNLFCRFIFVTLPCIATLAINAQSKKMFTILPETTTGVNFRNDITEDDKMFYYLYEYLYVGAGVSIGDFNNDGLQDIYFTFFE